MPNFFTDNKDLMFSLDNIDLVEAVKLREKDYSDAEKYDTAPIDYADAIDNYKRVMEVIGGICGNNIEPRARTVDREGPHFEDGVVTYYPLTVQNIKDLNDAGVSGAMLGHKYGGLNFPASVYTMMTEMVSRADASLQNLFGLQDIGETINSFGSEDQKSRYLPRFASGESTGAMVLTEPDAGSDVAGLKTKAVKDGDSYLINGSKLFITNGCQADFVTLLARTDDKPGFHSFGLFVVPTSLPGFVVSKKLDKLGMRSSDTAELFFDDMRVPAENLIGEAGEGFIIQMKQFQHERFSAMPLSYIAAKDIIDMTVAYIRKRIVFGKPLIKKQVLRHRLADWLTEIECMRHLTYHVTRLKAAGLDATREISMGKLMAGQLLNRVADGCLQMHGGMGFMNEMDISRYYRDARGLSIGGGADEVMRDVIAKYQGY